MMKRILALILAAVLIGGCSQRKLDTKPKKPQDEQSASSAQVQAAEPQQPEPEKEPQSPNLKLAKSYAEMLCSGKYYIDCTAVIEFEGMTLENPMLIAVEGENSSISVSSDLSGAMVTMRTLTLDGEVYVINDEQRSYMQVDVSHTAGGLNTDFSELEYAGSEKGSFCGDEHDCERFSCGDDTVRLFFENGALIGITRSIPDGEIDETVLKINGVSQNIPDRLIAMPLGYTKQ